MGFLDNNKQTIDAVVTRKGREKLAEGRFRITKFALSDDEIDYQNLWNDDHPKGSDFYGSAIENMPLLEAIANEHYALRHKLVSLPRTTIYLPIIEVQPTFIELTKPGQQSVITPTTSNGDNTFYTATLFDTSACTIFSSDTKSLNPDVFTHGTLPDSAFNKDGRSKTVTGKEFFIVANNHPFKEIKTEIVISGNDTAGRAVVQVTIKKRSANN